MYKITIDQSEKTSKITGYAGSFLIHAGILLLMWWLTITPPNPPYDNTGGGGGEGLAMAFGEPDAGGESLVPIENPTAQQQPQPPTPQPEENPVVTDESDEEPVVTTPPKAEVKPKPQEVKKPTEKPKPTEVTKPVEKPREVDKRSVFKKPTGGQAGGFGDGDAPGNQGSPDGVPGGDPNGNGYGNGGSGGGKGTGNGPGNGPGDGPGSGPGSGGGISFDLKGRSISRRPTIEDQSKETGKVVVSIVVDRNGRVTKAMPNQKGTTTLSAVLLEKAKRAALDTRFTPNTDGPEEQFGTMTITFKFRP